MDPHTAPRADPVRLTLEVVPGREPIAGSVRVRGGPARRFAGWIDLVAAVQEAIEPPERDLGDDRAATPG